MAPRKPLTARLSLRRALAASPRLAAILALATTLACAAAGGGAGANGSTRFDARASLTLESGQLLPGHRFYTTGSEISPEAILALREDRPLRSDAWRVAALTPASLQHMLQWMRGTRLDGPYTSLVLDDRGQRIGIWCSYLQPTPVRLLDDGGVHMAPPLHLRDDGPALLRLGGD